MKHDHLWEVFTVPALFLPLLVILAPTVVIAYLAYFGKARPRNRRVMLLLLAFVIATDGALLYLIWSGKLAGSPGLSLAEELAKYPPEAQAFAFTKVCQNMVREGASRKSRNPEAVETVSRSICTCISAGVMNHAEFAAIESMAKEGKNFGTIVGAHKAAIQAGMGKCGFEGT